MYVFGKQNEDTSTTSLKMFKLGYFEEIYSHIAHAIVTFTNTRIIILKASRIGFYILVHLKVNMFFYCL